MPILAIRDPIAGTGDFGREWDPIYKYQGRKSIKRRESGKFTQHQSTLYFLSMK